MVITVFSFLMPLNILPTPLLYSHSQTLEADLCPIHRSRKHCVALTLQSGYLGAVVSRNLHV